MNEDWYYSKNGQRLGPVLFTQLARLVSQGQITHTDLVWKQGMADWVPASRVNGLSGGSADGAADQAVHFLDYGLHVLRRRFSDTDFAQTNRVLVEIGRYSLYVAMLTGVILAFVLSTKTNRMDTLLISVGAVMGGLALQYSAIRASSAIERFIQATAIRMSSTAFLDICSVSMLTVGIVALAGGILEAIRLENVDLLLTALAVFMVCEQLALIAMNPRCLNLDISPQATCGEEAIGIMALLMMIPLRLVPGVFGMGTALGTLGLIYSGGLVLRGGEHVITGAIHAVTSAYAVAVCAAFPFVTYILFLVYYLMIDTVRAALIIPAKLDKLAEKNATTRT